MSGIEVVGLIGSIVGIIQFIAELSHSLKNAKDLPKAFQDVDDKIALVRDILRNVEKHIDGKANDGTYEAIKTILDSCKAKAKQLEKIFQAVSPSEDTPRIKRYALAAKSLGKGKRVEVLAKGMVEDTQLLVLQHTAQAATEDELAKLADAIEVLSEIDPSLPEEDLISQTHYGSGDNVARDKYGGNHNDIKEIHGNPIFGNVTNNHVQSKSTREMSLSELCLRSLAFEGMDSRPTEISTEAAGTCKWLLEHKGFKKWKSLDQSLLWIKGKPGSGKSTLLRYARDNITAVQKGKDAPLVLSFFFNGRGTALQKTEEGMFRSLLCQIQSELPEALKVLEDALKWRRAVSDEHDEDWQWAPGSLCQYFQQSLWVALKTRPVVLFIDALDESGESNAKTIAEECCSLIQRASVGHLRPLHICFTCRHYPVIHFPGALQICMEMENQRDISMFVENRLSSFTETTESNLAQYISNHAEGVFLWACLVTNKVLQLDRDRVGKKRIEAEVHRIPPTLDDFYCEVAQNMDFDSAQLIDWICFASRPLTLTELRWATISSRTQHDFELRSSEEVYPYNDKGMLKNIQVLGRGLIEHQVDSGVVQFIHQSVRDFFIEKGLALLRHDIKQESVAEIAHHRLLMTCLRYFYTTMEKPELRKPQDDIRTTFPFLHYATTSWVFHATNLSENDQEFFSWPSDDVLQELLRIARLLAPSTSWAKGTTIFHIISKEGMTMALRGILKPEQCAKVGINASDYYGRTPLSLAARYGRNIILEMLIANGANIEGTGHHIPLAVAIEFSKTTILGILLMNGAKVNYDYVAWYHLEPLIGGTIIQAIKQDKRIPDLVSLVKGLVFSESMVGWYITRSFSATIGGLTNFLDTQSYYLSILFSSLLVIVAWVIKPLIKAFVIRTCMKGSPTTGAYVIGFCAMITSIRVRIAAAVTTGAFTVFVYSFVWRRHVSFGTLIFLYAVLAVMQAFHALFFLANVVNEAGLGMWRTPLSRAAEIGDSRVVQLLLTYHAEPNRPDMSGGSPLSRATEEKRTAVLRILDRYIK